MIAYLQGTVLETHEDSVVLVCNGVGYEVTVTTVCAQELTAGNSASLYIAESIAPYGGTVLYGFLRKEDKELWDLFREAIPKTGGKKAMEYLNKAMRSVADFHNAIVKRDPKILTSIFGFTTKTAEKLITSLKDKMDTLTVQGESKIKVLNEAPYMEGVLEALTALGYSVTESRRAIDKLYTQGLDPNEKLENIVKSALRVLTK